MKKKMEVPEEIRELYGKAREGFTKPTEWRDTGEWYFRDPDDLLFGPLDKKAAVAIRADLIAEKMHLTVSDDGLLLVFLEIWPPDIRRAIGRIFAQNGEEE